MQLCVALRTREGGVYLLESKESLVTGLSVISLLHLCLRSITA